jgi:S-adenosylmethionine:tRNA ribosyltransferase-isomerase
MFAERSVEPLASLDFELPPELEATAPPEARGLARDQVRLMVSRYASESGSPVVHARFDDLPRFLGAGDLIVLNTSGTLSAALPAIRPDGTRVLLHLSTRLPDGTWTVELRQPGPGGSKPLLVSARDETLRLPAGASATLLRPYQYRGRTSPRLWVARLAIAEPIEWYLEDHGTPIRYGYVPRAWPPLYYQTVYATEMGSAEMPSAGRAFTNAVLASLAARGVQIAALILHTGVASLESHEPPYEEFFRVPEPTARALNAARAAGRRVIAVGTTVVRALESAADAQGQVQAGSGWTDLMVTPERGVRAVNALLTGLHEPRATHLAMLAAICGERHLRLAYAEALHERYLWHEFGDLHLILP